MPLRIIKLTLDLDRKQYYYPALEMVQGDNMSLRIDVTVIQEGKPIDLSDHNISFFANFPRTKEFIFDSDNVTSTSEGLKSGTFSYTFPMQANQVAGDYTTARFNIISEDGAEISKMARFQYHVEADSAEGSVEAETWVSDFEALLKAIQEMNQKFNDAVAEINEAILNAQNTQEELESEMQALRDEIAKSGYVSKTGDNMSGTLNLDAQEAFNVRYGAIKHYVGSNLALGTEVTFSIGYDSTHYLPEDTLIYVIGGDPVGDSRFAITNYSMGYVYGYAPADYTWGKSVVNGKSTPAKTITPANAISVKRDGTKASVRINKGYALTNEVVAVPNLNAALEFGVDYYVDAGAQNAPVALGTGTQGSLYSIRRSASSVIQMYMHYTGRVFTRYFLNNAPYIHSKTDANGWSELASISDAQAKADKALSDAKSYFDSTLTVQKVTLTPKNGFTASRTLTASYVKVGNRYWVSIGGIVAKGTGTGTGICATVPAMLAPDTDWNKLFSGAQQSTAASNHANIYLSSGGDINIVAVGAADVNTGLDGIAYFTKEVTA